MDRGRDCSQNHLTSSGGPSRASRPGVFPLVSGGRAGTSRPGGGHGARPRPHSSQQEEKERGPGEAGQLAGRESRARALGAGEPPPAPLRLAVRGVGRGDRPPPQAPGLSVLRKMRPLLRAGSALMAGGGEGCRGGRRGPDTEWRARESLAARPPGAAGGGGPSWGRAQGGAAAGAGTWVRSLRAASPPRTSVCRCAGARGCGPGIT